jgi:CheY-like chemotaxis protein
MMAEPSRVLVVDDDPPTCELISEVLSAAEIEAYGVTDSMTAGTRIYQQKFDAVFLDAHMPSPDGLELARRMRASGLNKKSVIVMITGEKEKTLLQRAFEAGINFVLFKPVDRQSLIRLLRVTQGSIDREKRRAIRIKIRCALGLEFGAERVQGKTFDLSVSGMLVQTDRRFPVGTPLKANLTLEGQKSSLRLNVRVVRLVGDDCMGLEIENMNLSDTQALEEFLLPHVMKQNSNA